MWDRADLLNNLTLSAYYLGRFATCDERLPELAIVAGRAGHHGAVYVYTRIQSWLQLARSGDIRTALGDATQLLGLPIFTFASRAYVGAFSLYLGRVDQALAHLETAVAEQPPHNFYLGMPEANLFAAVTLTGPFDRARALIPSVVSRLPVSGRRSVHGAYCALDVFVSGLTLIRDRDRCGALYSLTLDYISSGTVLSPFFVAPSSPQLAAALAADAAGLVDQSREHFEIALRQAREVPVRILQPTVLYWYGRALSAAADIADRARGRAMVEVALTDFRTLEMVLHANLADQFLRDGR